IPTPPAPPKVSKKEKRQRLGNYEVHDSGKGFVSIRQISSGEIMHSVNPPQVEAENLYLNPSRVIERLKEQDEVVIWDVGLGAASNAMAVILARLKESGSFGKLRIISFENDLDPLRLAVRNSSGFPHLHHAAPQSLLKQGEWNSDDHQIHWQLVYGDFLEKFEGQPLPDIIFYDPFSLNTDSPLWTAETFGRLYKYCQGKKVQLLTYTASTAIRETLLAQGFFVGYGPATGPKANTTMAFTDLEQALTLGANLLGPEWLTRWERSGARKVELSQLVTSHPQFSLNKK